MSKPRLLRIAALVVLILGATAYWAFRRFSAGDPANLEASGTIETTEVEVAFQVAGKVREMLVQEGDRVSQGQVLARLDREPLRGNVERAAAQLEAARAAAAQLRTQLEWTRASVAERQRSARSALKAAQARAQEVRTGPRAQELRAGQAALAGAEANLAKAKLDRDRAAELVRRKVYAQAALDAAEAAYVEAKSARDRAAENLELLREGSRREQITASEAELEQARAAVEQADADRMQIDIRQRDVQAAEARVDELAAGLKLAQINLEYAELKAPIAGWVLVKSIEAGEVVNVGTPVVTLGDVDDLWMNVYAGAQAVGRLRLGDPAEIKVDSHPRETFAGKIVFISREAEFTPKNIQTKEERTKLVYRVKVAIPNRNQILKPGMPADAVLRLRVS